MRGLDGGFGIYFFWRLCFVIKLNMGLRVSAKGSIICCFSLLRLCMSKRSNVFSNCPFLSMRSISSVSFIVLYICPVPSIAGHIWNFVYLFLWQEYIPCILL
jgi:hypothetical protein